MAAPEPNPASATNLDAFASIAGLQTLGEADAIDHEDEDETVTPEDALASAIKQLQALTAENAELRRDLAEQRTTHISLREANRELEWRCRAGGEGGDPEGAAEKFRAVANACAPTFPAAAPQGTRGGCRRPSGGQARG